MRVQDPSWFVSTSSAGNRGNARPLAAAEVPKARCRTSPASLRGQTNREFFGSYAHFLQARPLPKHEVVPHPPRQKALAAARPPGGRPKKSHNALPTRGHSGAGRTPFAGGDRLSAPSANPPQAGKPPASASPIGLHLEPDRAFQDFRHPAHRHPSATDLIIEHDVGLETRPSQDPPQAGMSGTAHYRRHRCQWHRSETTPEPVRRKIRSRPTLRVACFVVCGDACCYMNSDQRDHGSERVFLPS